MSPNGHCHVIYASNLTSPHMAPLTSSTYVDHLALGTFCLQLITPQGTAA